MNTIKYSMERELRKDYFGNWVIIAEKRKFRPKHFERAKKESKAICPFCPGNEKETPPETDRIEEKGNWIFRSFPNKYSFAPQGYIHEVITETRQHGQRLSQFDKEHMLALFKFYQRRIKNAGKGYAYLFKNEGATAGASIAHSHSQLVTLPKPRVLLTEAKKLDFKKIKKEEEEMIIKENETAFSYCPKASHTPYETWIVCKRKNSTVGNLKENELRDVSELLLEILKKIDNKLGRPDFNIYHHDNGPDYHMHIVPRITTLAGMENGVNVYINQLPPEKAVRFYK